MSYKGYTDNDVIEAVKTSSSIRQVITKLGLVPAGGNYSTINQKIKELNLTTLHFLGQGWTKGKTRDHNTKPIVDYLSGIRLITSHKLRLRLLKDKIFEHKCYACSLTTWLDKPIPLELEHKDGNHSNNKLENLTLLCPNCHAFTSTYRGKNKK